MKIYIGWDSREDEAYQVARYSILKQNGEVLVISLKMEDLRKRGLYWRDVDQQSSTEFTFTRFLVPYLNGYEGWAVFMDCDFLILDDPKKLFDLADEKYAVQVVKHDYTPTAEMKMDGQRQYPYPRKNWSSMMLFNCSHPANRLLDLENVNSQSGAWLHQLQWLDDSLIGEIGRDWNWLVDWYHEPTDGHPKALHFTEGGPWLENYQDVGYAAVWSTHYQEILSEK